MAFNDTGNVLKILLDLKTDIQARVIKKVFWQELADPKVILSYLS